MKNKTTLRNLVAAGGVWMTALGCATTTQSGSPVAGAEAAVVATYGDRSVTLVEVDELIRGELEDLEKQRYALREQALQGLVVQELIEREARRQGVASGKEVIKSYLAEHVVPPTEADAEKFFDENVKPTAPQATFVEFRERVVGYLVEEANRTAMLAYFDRMQKEAGLQITLKAPTRTRVVLDTAGASKGPDSAAVTLVEFADFQCPYCSEVGSVLDEMVAAFPGKVRVVFKHFPLSFHDKASKASEASLCAGDQGRFWEYHDLLFTHQEGLEIEQLKGHAEALKLDEEQFKSCLDSNQFAEGVRSDLEAGQSAGVKGTPSVYVNGLLMDKLDSESLKRVIEAELTSLN